MLAYFPAVYPGELLYSVLARYQRHVGVPGMMHTLDALFGSRKVIASFDLPGHLQVLIDNIPTRQGITIDFIIDALTLYPYTTAFEPPELQAQVRKAMRNGSVDGLYVRLGLAAFRIGRLERLRFCADCCQKMLEEYKELYWRRDHQLPSVLVCPEHGVPLQESSISFVQCSRHEFIAPNLDNCSFYAKSVLTDGDLNVLPHLQRLACSSAKLLDSSLPARNFAEWTSFYRNKMRDVGLTRSANTMDQQQLHRAFLAFYGRTLDELPGVIDGDRFAGDWLATMVRKHRKACHPLYHLLLQDFLAQQESRSSPFGQGPWPCRNPLANHYEQPIIRSIGQHGNHGKTVGVFTCSCGYVYTCCWNSDAGTLGPPRFQRYGALLEPALQRLLNKGSSLREIGRCLQLDPKTVTRVAKELGFSIPWKTASSDSEVIVSHSRKSPKNIADTSLFRPGGVNRAKRTRCDWHRLDEEWVAKLTAIVLCVFQETPPVRITISELERRIGRRGYLGKRQHNLPKTTQFLKEVVEDVGGFQLRRARWAIVELLRESDHVKAWQVLRMAGLSSTCLPIVMQLIDARTGD